MDKQEERDALDVWDRQVSVKTCARMTSIPYGWLLDQVERGLNPPPRYRRAGHRQFKVKPREVLEWYEKTTAQA